MHILNWRKFFMSFTIIWKVNMSSWEVCNKFLVCGLLSKSYNVCFATNIFYVIIKKTKKKPDCWSKWNRLFGWQKSNYCWYKLAGGLARPCWVLGHWNSQQLSSNGCEYNVLKFASYFIVIIFLLRTRSVFSLVYPSMYKDWWHLSMLNYNHSCAHSMTFAYGITVRWILCHTCVLKFLPYEMIENWHSPLESLQPD